MYNNNLTDLPSGTASKGRADRPGSCRPGLGRLRPFLRQEPAISQAQDTPESWVCFDLERLKGCVLAIDRDCRLRPSVRRLLRVAAAHKRSGHSLKFGKRVLLGFGDRRNCLHADESQRHEREEWHFA